MFLEIEIHETFFFVFLAEKNNFRALKFKKNYLFLANLGLPTEVFHVFGRGIAKFIFLVDFVGIIYPESVCGCVIQIKSLV
jgi:hypothetical protein